MDSQDSSAAPLQPPHHHHHLHQPAPVQQHHHLISGGPPPNHNSPYSNTSNSVVMHPQNPNPRFAFNNASPNKPLDQLHSQQQPQPQQHYDNSTGGWFNVEPARKKRGRPRKYSPDNNNNNTTSSSNNIGLGLSTANNQISADVGSSETKKHRGRPPGSGKKQMDALGVPGVGFTPHVIIVQAGEDIASKIMAFAQEGPRTVCILSAHGVVCNVTLRQPVSGSTVTYEGRFNIVSLAGSFSPSERNSNSGGSVLSVSLAGTDARVLGGGVAGMLKAASPVQVIVGSFIEDGKRSKGIASSSTPSNMLNFSTPPQGGTGGSSSSPGGSSESVDEENDDNALDRGYPNPGQPIQNLPTYPNMAWR